ncbi:DUF5131 family protein [Pseudomonas aeruginosa]
MAGATEIEWTDATWNPLKGCSRISTGCSACYAEPTAARIIAMDRGRGVPEGQGSYDGLLARGGQWNGTIREATNVLDQPLRWARSRLIFVNSMSDLFHENASVETLDRIFAVMLACATHGDRNHIFQVLTKRPQRMLQYMQSRSEAEHLEAWSKAGDAFIQVKGRGETFSQHVFNLASRERSPEGAPQSDGTLIPWGFTKNLFPLPNVWLGVSVENQACAEERIPLLMQTPAAIRWISAEPLLGAVDLTAWLEIGSLESELGLSNPGIDWVVVGGESGQKARPMHPSWARSIRDQCAAAGVPFLFKQWGEWFTNAFTMSDGKAVFREFSSYQSWVNKANTWVNGGICLDRHGVELRNGADMARARDSGGFPVTVMHKVGKRNAGRELDGKLYDEYPPNHLHGAASQGAAAESCA